MTYCIGKDGKALRVVGPDYVHHYPTFKRVQLAAVKEKLYNPNLPTLRHEDRDNVIGRLSDEHCKTTTCCTPRDFAETEMNAFKPPVERMHCLDITRTGRAVSNMYFTPQEVQLPWPGPSLWRDLMSRQPMCRNISTHMFKTKIIILMGQLSESSSRKLETGGRRSSVNPRWTPTGITKASLPLPTPIADIGTRIPPSTAICLVRCG
ncbi:uncharacterized protein LOC106063523 isoform X2 [Biomphalaria glabrata]|uniref:Uncharacterized protein LOC106063523 isoform X2 n=1 Tax=Biomphalaria glabrata TaxID=6526 RepID=A0A9W2Z7C5_BIOGL|nr:uncharacterized protein LOC106063523 isoform X2 [Biomphalaria glabrata]